MTLRLRWMGRDEVSTNEQLKLNFLDILIFDLNFNKVELLDIVIFLKYLYLQEERHVFENINLNTCITMNTL